MADGLPEKVNTMALSGAALAAEGSISHHHVERGYDSTMSCSGRKGVW